MLTVARTAETLGALWDEVDPAPELDDPAGADQGRPRAPRTAA